jgi:5-carboxymethyl-2-hydroxymuconate isomerase
MPHFVIDCAKEILEKHTEQYINEQIHAVAAESGLFDANDIKVRVNPFSIYSVGNKPQAFIHVFASIMQGRTETQRKQLSVAVLNKLIDLFPNVPNIAMNVDEFEKATYCNRASLGR